MSLKGRRLNPCFSGLYYLTPRPIRIQTALCLNPCFSGLYYLTISQPLWNGKGKRCLNPCFSGLYYLTCHQNWHMWETNLLVLILVLVDFTTWPQFISICTSCWAYVLILVLVDFTTWRLEKLGFKQFAHVLILVLVDFTTWQRTTNPGQCYDWRVLILVLVDFTIWHMACAGFFLSLTSLNPCFSGLYYRRYRPGMCVRIS